MWENVIEGVFWFFDRATFFVFVGFLLVGLYFIPVHCVRTVIREWREKKQSEKQIREIIETMEKKPRITRKPGKYRPMNWAAKWVAYSKDLPAPRCNHYQTREMPPLPKKDE